MKKEKPRFQAIVNKRARHDYEVLDTYDAGVQLTGAEVKSLRMGRGQLSDSFARVSGSQLTLVNMHIGAYPFARNEEYDPTRSRMLLMKRREIEKLRGKLEQKGMSLIPLKVYLSHNLFKVELGLVRGKKQYEKREAKRLADVKREVEREVKARYRG